MITATTMREKKNRFLFSQESEARKRERKMKKKEGVVCGCNL
jgi:hypothetical protein